MNNTNNHEGNNNGINTSNDNHDGKVIFSSKNVMTLVMERELAAVKGVPCDLVSHIVAGTSQKGMTSRVQVDHCFHFIIHSLLHFILCFTDLVTLNPIPQTPEPKAKLV